MTQLVPSEFTKKNSFESLRILNRASSPELEVKRALRILNCKADQFESSVANEVVALVTKELNLQLIHCDPNLKASAQKFCITDLIAEEMARLPDNQIINFLYHRYRYDVFPVERRLGEYPPCVQIEPSSICNYRCRFCFQANEEFSGHKSPHMGVMSIESFKRAVDFIQGKVEIVSFASRGEPTICKDFSEMMEYSSDKFISLKINTNASLLSEKIVHSLLSGNPKTIVFSIDAGNKLAYEDLRVNGNYEHILRKLKVFDRIRRSYYSRSKNIVRISGVYLGQNQSMEEMCETFGEYADQILFVKYNPWEDPYASKEPITNNACSDLWRRMFIWQDLRLNPCDTDYLSHLSIGNLDDFHSLEMAWHSDGYNRLRFQHLAGDRQSLIPCRGCSLI